ncbi:hypothetical protein [Halalkalicoccus tibetensis]|uniref:Uncharacterized protein n=1 Tax=Halalkalicoccus tibetensis TaxID=175632 RepID=A0ABD5VD71_9EURY
MAAESLDEHARQRRRQRAVATLRERVLPLLAVLAVGVLIGVLVASGATTSIAITVPGA